MDVARHDADFASVWRDHAGAVWPDEAAFAAFKRALDAHHVKHGMPSVMQTISSHFGVDRFKDGVRREGGRHVDHRGVGLCDVHGFVDRVEDGQLEMRLPPLPGVTPPTILVP